MPGVLTAIAAVITALVGVYVAARDDGGSSEPLVLMIARDLGVDEEAIVETDVTYDDYVTASDETGTLYVEVPAEWSDISTAPDSFPDGTPIPEVRASTDLDGLADTWDVPGVSVAALDTSVIDVPGAMTQFAPPACTTTFGREPYDDSVFEGEIEYFGDCAGTDTVFMLLAAHYKADPYRIAIVRAQLITVADYDAVQHVLGTSNFTG